MSSRERCVSPFTCNPAGGRQPASILATLDAASVDQAVCAAPLGSARGGCPRRMLNPHFGVDTTPRPMCPKVAWNKHALWTSNFTAYRKDNATSNNAKQ